MKRPVQNQILPFCSGVAFSISVLLAPGLCSLARADSPPSTPSTPGAPSTAPIAFDAPKTETPKPEFKDYKPLVSALTPQPEGACGRSAQQHPGLTPWKRGYEQASSGERFRIPLKSEIRVIQGRNQCCLEYSKPDSGFTSDDLACCMAGCGAGTTDLQTAIVDYAAGKKPVSAAAKSKEFQACYQSFGAGRAAGNERCEQLKLSDACNPPNLDKKIPYIGCASLGYLAEILRCPKVQAEKEALDRALNNGALCGSALPPYKDAAPESGPQTPAPPPTGYEVKKAAAESEATH